jgi:hypothetical protein
VRGRTSSHDSLVLAKKNILFIIIYEYW